MYQCNVSFTPTSGVFDQFTIGQEITDFDYNRLPALYKRNFDKVQEAESADESESDDSADMVIQALVESGDENISFEEIGAAIDDKDDDFQGFGGGDDGGGGASSDWP